MSKTKEKEQSLPRLQKKIILYLAEHEPQTRNGVNKEIGSTYKSILFSFRSLEKKGFIEVVSQKSHRQQKFPEYWLSVRGVAFALLNGVEAKRVRKNALGTIHNEEDRKALEIYLDIRKASPMVANILDKWVLGLGKLEPQTLILQLIPEMLSLKESEKEALFKSAKKYPEYWKHTENAIERIIEALGKVVKP